MPSTKGLYESVTNDIVKHLEQGVRPWTSAWRTNPASGVCLIPTNAASGRAYSGMNTLLLWMAAAQKGYPTHGWVTFRQANEMQAKVRKGEKSTTVIYVSWKNIADEGQPEKLSPRVKAYSVFNLAQLDNLPEKFLAPAEPWPDRLEAFKKMVDATGITVQPGAKPCYFPAPDVVQMPNHSDFNSDDDFVSTLGHELIHAVGHPSRLNRKMAGKVFKEQYAAEECVAELGSAFLCAHTGFSYIEAQSPAYIESWLKVLKADSRAIFSIASYASQAADWIRDRQHAVTAQTPDCERPPQQEAA